jgi:hypothetical protein
MLKFTLSPFESNLFTNSKFAYNLGNMEDILDFDPPCVPLHFTFYKNGAFAHNLFHAIISHEFFF